jgi:hypothetical protein
MFYELNLARLPFVERSDRKGLMRLKISIKIIFIFTIL